DAGEEHESQHAAKAGQQHELRSPLQRRHAPFENHGVFGFLKLHWQSIRLASSMIYRRGGRFEPAWGRDIPPCARSIVYGLRHHERYEDWDFFDAKGENHYGYSGSLLRLMLSRN